MILFLPLVLAAGGNVGSQSATLIIRMLAVEQTGRRENWQILVRESKLAMLLGGGLAVPGCACALFFVGYEPAIVVGITIFLVVVMGTVAGAMLPLGMDPALMSNPLIAALVDVMGVVIYFGVAMTLIGST